jgi:hypothetical protein
MYFSFGKKSKEPKVPGPPELAGTEFGRYLRYGRRAAFGRRYFGNRIPQFGTQCDSGMPKMNFGLKMPDFGKLTLFGKRRRHHPRKGGRKGLKKPPASLIRMCKRHGIKCTRKVGRKRVYKSVSVLKKQLRRKKNLKKKKKNVKVHHRRRRARFGKRLSLFGFKF